MNIFLKIAYKTKDKNLARNVARSREDNIRRILELRAARGKGYENSSNAVNNYNTGAVRSKIENKMLSNVRTNSKGKVDLMVGRKADPVVNTMLSDKINNMSNKLNDPNLSRNITQRFLDNKNRRIEELNRSNRKKGIGIIGAGVGSAALAGLGYHYLSGNAGLDAESISEQAAQLQQSPLERYGLPLGLGVGALGAGLMMNDKNKRREIVNGREYNPYSQI